MNKKRITALLPMKANSERVRGKNFRLLGGKPLFRWVLDTLLSVAEIDEVLINTDARAILLEQGLSEGGRVVIRDRKPELCGDLTSMNLILADDVAARDSGLYLMTHTTNPFLSASTIRRALAAFTEAQDLGRADSLFSVNRVQTRFYREDGSAINHDPDKLVRTQDLEPWYEENSNLYLFTRQSFAAMGARIGKNPMLFETPRLESLDIDDQDDWDIAEALARYREVQEAKS